MTATFQRSLAELLVGFSPALEPLDHRRLARFCRAFAGRLWRRRRSLSGPLMAIGQSFSAHLVSDLEVF
jgi:hypothetical protein